MSLAPPTGRLTDSWRGLKMDSIRIAANVACQLKPAAQSLKTSMKKHVDISIQSLLSSMQT